MKLQENIYRYRKEKGYSQEELGVLCHVSRQAVSKWENGSSKPDSDNLVLLAKYLEVSTDELLGVEHEKSPYQKEDVPPYHEVAYTSNIRIFNIPLIDVYFRVYYHRYAYGFRLGFGRGTRCAKGIIAIGTKAVGLFTLSIFGLGIFGIGIFNIGLIASAGIFSLSALYVFGIISLALYFAFGVVAIGAYAFGVLAVGFQTAVGVAAFGQHAVAILADGAHRYLIREGTSCIIDPQQYENLQLLQQDTFMPTFMKALLSHLPLC